MKHLEEVEAALTRHPKVDEAAVVGRADGESMACFVTLAAHGKPSEEVREELREYLALALGDEAVARLAAIRVMDFLPKTRSGHVMRRLLGDIANGS
jgi:acetyl-CoA synthetase